MLRTVRGDVPWADGFVPRLALVAAVEGSVYTGDEVRMNRLGAVSVRRYGAGGDDWLGLRPAEFEWMDLASQREQIRVLVAAGGLAGVADRTGASERWAAGPTSGATPPAAGGDAPGEPRRVPSPEGTLERARRMLLDDLLVLEEAIKALDARDPERLMRAHRRRVQRSPHAFDIALSHAVSELELEAAGGSRA